MKKVFFTFLLSIIFLFNSAFASGFADRQAAFVNQFKDGNGREALMLQAYTNQPLNQEVLDKFLLQMTSESVADFSLVQMIRVLYLTNGEYDHKILPAVNQLRFWLEKGEDWLVHYTENHMSMWMSSEYLLHQKYGREMSADLVKRLKHYLFLKINYGFYEYFSSVYLPYTLSGLLNLVDFCEDEEISSMAELAAKRLLSEILMVTNDKGVFYPTAGRNYVGKYLTPYQQNHNALIYLITEMGEAPNSPTHASTFLATSKIDMEDVAAGFQTNLDTKFAFGHTLQEGRTLNLPLSRLDRAIFTLSYGGYFHPYVSNQTQWLMNTYGLWDHKEFESFSMFKGIPKELGNLVAKVGAAVSKSSVISGQTVAVYKNKGVVLTSSLDKWKGYLGYQIWPYCATVETIPVFTISGDPAVNWEDWSSTGSNTHLPYVWQESNVALVMYRPDPLPELLGFKNKEVNLYFPENEFDEVRHNGKWMIGRKAKSYVAVRRYSDEMMNGRYYASNIDGQAWVVVVGNEDVHGSFNDFENVIDKAVFYENWFYKKNTNQWIYHASINVDGKFIEHKWPGIFKPVNTTIREESPEINFTLSPNPASNLTHFKLKNQHKEQIDLKIFNTYGQMVFSGEYESVENMSQQISLSHLTKGMYHVVVKAGEQMQSTPLFVE